MTKIQISHSPIAIFWHRRDLRIGDNSGLFHALNSGMKVLPLFIFDTGILDRLENMQDARVEFINETLGFLKNEYEKHKGSMMVVKGKPIEVFKELIKHYNVEAVYANNDYEPYARKRDKEVNSLLHSSGIPFHTYKDHVIFEKDEVMKADGSPYTVFTPYMRKWKEHLQQNDFKIFDTNSHLKALLALTSLPFPTLEEIGFKPSQIEFPAATVDIEVIRKYHLQRNTPAVKGTTKLGMHLRFGKLSTREMVRLGQEYNEEWLNELIWREFFQMILYHFPHTVEKSFKPVYDRIEWINDEKQFKAWCEGKTGFPIVDAGMRELAETGFMHNRVRMITASFLVKDLLIDWRWGEAWFAKILLDYEQASNVGNWQWVAGSGCDAAPYFRVFNPDSQSKKFDPNGEYIQHWIPELNSSEYPEPIVDHAYARERALKVFRSAIRIE